MKRLVWLLASVAALAGSSAHGAPLSAYGKLPNIEEAAISPDGSTVGYIVTDGENRSIVTQRLSDMKLTNVVGVGDNKVRSIAWAGNNNLIITRTETTAAFVGNYRGEHALSFDFNLSKHRLRQLLTDIGSEYHGAMGVTVRTLNGQPALFVQGYPTEAGGGRSIYSIDLNSDGAHLTQAGAPLTDDWEIGPDGQAVGQTLSSARNNEWTLRIRDARGTWTENRHLTLADATQSPPAMVGMGRDGHSLLMSELQGDRWVLREIGPDGRWSEPLPTPVDASPIHDPITGKMIGYGYLEDDRAHYSFYDLHDQKVWNAIVASFEGDPVDLVGWSEDRKKYLVLSDSPTDGPGYFVVDMNTKHSTWIGNTYPALKPGDISPKTLIHYKAADDLDLPAYLTLPKGKMAKNLPLIVFPHGGPQARDEPGFDWWAQAMASRGYAVLQPQFRGSEGFGRKFIEAGFGQWGRKMQTDLSDGVRYLAAQGTIDPKRVCIVGASYGGYAALAGPTLDPGVYRCAVSYAGPADMAKMTEWSLSHHGLGAEHYWIKFMGAETNRDQAFASISPARYAARADAPILMIHGKDDTVVPLEQSQIMANALKAAGKPVEFVVLPGQDHWLSRGDTRLKMLEATVAFVEKHNPSN